MATLKAVAASVACSLCVPILALGPAALIGWEMEKQVVFWQENYQYQKDQYVYYFDGANKRGLLELCPDDSGQPSVRFKDDCR